MVLNMPFDTNVSMNDVNLVRDYSGYENNGTLKNFDFDADSGWTSSGKVGGAYNFDGDDYIDLPNDLGYTTQVSAFAWFKHEGTPPGDYHIIFGGQELEISIPVSTGQIRTGVYTDIRYVSNHGSGLVDGNWHFVGFTFNGSTKRSYIDGNFVGDQDVSGTLTYSFSYRRIGRFGSSATYYLNGSVDEVRIYDRALSADQIYALYQESKDGYSYKSTIVSQETEVNDQWKCSVTPTDGKDDGETKNSSVLTVNDDSYTGGHGTTCDATNKCFMIKDSTGTMKARLDQFGYVDVKGSYSNGQSFLSPPANSFVIKDSGGNVMLYVDSSGNLATKGYFYKDSSPSPSGGNDFIVQNSTNIAGYIDGGTGSMYFMGQLHYNSNF